VEVTGAQPGDVIEVSITALRTIGWGWNSFPLGVGALPHDFAEPYVHYFTFDAARTTAADRLTIVDVITRADEAASRGDADAYAELFTEDAVLDGTQGRHAGRAAMRASVGPVWAAEGPAMLHLTLNPVIEPGTAATRPGTPAYPRPDDPGRDRAQPSAGHLRQRSDLDRGHPG
jgi:hypothetical protein